MIEIRTFDGTPDELAEFCVRCWSSIYSGTDMPFALWSGDFLDWGLFDDRGKCSDLLVAAYDGARLVGVLPAWPSPVRLYGENLDTTHCSYFSVDPDYRKSRVAAKLNIESRRRHREQDIPFMFGYVFTGATASKGADFWLKQPKNVKVVRRMGHWVRILDHATLAEFDRNRLDRWGAKVVRLWEPRLRPPGGGDGVRPFRSTDLDACRALLDDQAAHSELSAVWSDERLRRQLDFRDVAKTLVVEEDSQVTGFINYSHLEFRHVDDQGDSRMMAAVIDLLSIERASSRSRARLLKHALHKMVSEGCHLAMMIRLSCYAWGPLLRQGFVMQPAADYSFTMVETNGRKAPERLSKMHVCWR